MSPTKIGSDSLSRLSFGTLHSRWSCNGTRRPGWAAAARLFGDAARLFGAAGDGAAGADAAAGLFKLRRDGSDSRGTQQSYISLLAPSMEQNWKNCSSELFLDSARRAWALALAFAFAFIIYNPYFIP